MLLLLAGVVISVFPQYLLLEHVSWSIEKVESEEDTSKNKIEELKERITVLFVDSNAFFFHNYFLKQLYFKQSEYFNDCVISVPVPPPKYLIHLLS